MKQKIVNTLDEINDFLESDELETLTLRKLSNGEILMFRSYSNDLYNRFSEISKEYEEELIKLDEDLKNKYSSLYYDLYEFNSLKDKIKEMLKELS